MWLHGVVSIPVDLDELEAATAEYGWAYVLSVGDDERVKIVACPPTWHDGLLCLAAGGGSARNAAARPALTVAFPPLDPDGYTLIVDGDASVADGHDAGDGSPPAIHVAPTGAVLHRPAPAGFTNTATGCRHDCAPSVDS